MADELDRVARVIDSVVRDARIPRRREREELRRELWTHFEESGTSPQELALALGRFGEPAALAGCFRAVYRREYLLFHALKLAVSLLASAVVALLIDTVANLRPGLLPGSAVWRLAPEFSRTALISVAVALGAVSVWEALRRPFRLSRGALSIALYALASLLAQAILGSGSGFAFVAAGALIAVVYATSRLEIRPAGLLAAYLAIFLIIYLVHRGVTAPVGVAQSLVVSAALLAVWASSLAIQSRLDRAFSGLAEGVEATEKT